MWCWRPRIKTKRASKLCTKIWHAELCKFEANICGAYKATTVAEIHQLYASSCSFHILSFEIKFALIPFWQLVTLEKDDLVFFISTNCRQCQIKQTQDKSPLFYFDIWGSWTWSLGKKTTWWSLSKYRNVTMRVKPLLDIFLSLSFIYSLVWSLYLYS